MSSTSNGPSSLNPFYSNILVLRKIPAPLRTSSSLEEWIKIEAGYASEGASVLRWHDDDTAIVSFCEPLAATAALPLLLGAGRLGERFREAHEASHPFGALPKLSASVAASGVIPATTPITSSNTNAVAARLRQEALMPSPLAPAAARPLSDTSVASRLIRGALGPQRHVLGGGRVAPSDPASTGAGYLRPVAPLPERGSGALASWRHATEPPFLSAAAAVAVAAAAAQPEINITSTTTTRPTVRGRGATTSSKADSESDWRDSTLLRQSGGGGGGNGGGGGRGWDEDRDVAHGVVIEGGMREALWNAERSLTQGPAPTPQLVPPPPPPKDTNIKRRPLILTATAAAFDFSAPLPAATSPLRPLILSATAAAFDFSR
jgi:hypothetical protein